MEKAVSSQWDCVASGGVIADLPYMHALLVRVICSHSNVGLLILGYCCCCCKKELPWGDSEDKCTVYFWLVRVFHSMLEGIDSTGLWYEPR